MALPPGQDKSKPSLSFQPLTDGLGFHPFSDGLPYAPVAKTQVAQRPSPGATGTGAVAAGRPSFVTTPSPAPRFDAGAQLAQHSIRPAAARISVPIASQALRQKPSVAHPLAQPPGKTAALAPEAQARPGYGYLLKRVLAFALDTAFNLSLCVGALSAALWKQDLSPELLLTPGIVALAALFLAVFSWAITTAQEVAFGTSVGKRFFRLALNGGTSAIFLRAFFFVPSACFAGIGLAWALFDRRKRCWHDLVVDLQPVEIARL